VTALRRFVVIGQKATASPEFLLNDLPGTSGRLDVLLRCLRAALLVSHGLRGDTMIYLVLLGGERAPRTLRIDGAVAAYVRPDERSLATLAQKALATPTSEQRGAGAQGRFTLLRRGIAVADGGLDVVLEDLGACTPYVLEESAPDVREASLTPRPGVPDVFFVGDHLGFDEVTRARIAELGAQPISVGPVSVHADDAVALLVNELDRRASVVKAGVKSGAK
jgi:tRNA (pseudouridine54-N1)-methyltransferase